MKYICLIFVLSLVAGSASAQYSSRNNEAKLDADYYLMTQEYDRAIRLYQNILKTEPENADIKYKIGICYLNTETEKKTAIQYLEEAAQKVSEKYNPNSFKEMNAPVDAYFLLGSAYRVDNQLDKAQQAYKSYKELLNPRDEYNNLLVDQYIRNCAVAKEMLQNPINIKAENLGSPINNEIANFNPVVSGNGRTLVYTSPGRQRNDIFYTTLVDGAWEEPRNITSQLGGSNRLFKTVSISHDGLTLYLVYQDPFDSDIYTSTYSRNRWSRAEKMSKPINGKSNETHASITPDGNTIYFTSDRRGGEGDLDIYKTSLNNKGKWGKPVNLGPHINTLFNEESPFISPDGSLLFFSSEGLEGMGGFDIFKIDLTDPDAEAVNMGYPINTTDNNYFFYPLDDGTSGYYAMNYNGSYGSQDIYLVDILPPENTNFPVMGTIRSDYNIDTLPASTFYVRITDLISGEIINQAVEPDENLQFSFELPPGNYQISVTSEGFSPYTGMINIPEDFAGQEIHVDAFMVYQIPAEETLSEQPLASVPGLQTDTIPSEIDSMPVSQDVLATVSNEPTSETSAEPETTTYADVPVNISGSVSYTLQLMALKNPVDLTWFKNLNDVSVTYTKDNWFRYTWGLSSDPDQAEMLKNELREKGYTDAFIVKKEVLPRYTIQVMAVPGPVVDLKMFDALSSITVTRSTDIFCRYTTGEYETIEQARESLEIIRQLGFPNAFVRKW